MYDTLCNSTTFPSTLLFAYSNDLSPKTVLDSWNAFTAYHIFYNWYGSVRFDVENLDIRFHENKGDVNLTIANNLPDPNKGFLNSSIGSNVFDVIEKFFSNTQAPVCGSRIIVLLKRYPDEADVSRLVSLIRSHHAMVNVMTSATPSGGSQPKTMYSVASKTNGMGAFEYDEYFKNAIGYFPIYSYLYPVYATTTQVSGSGTKTLPDFYPPVSDFYDIAITYQDHVPDDSFQNLTLRWTSPVESGSINFNSRDVSDWYGGTYARSGSINNVANCKMSLVYNYSGQDAQNLQIRIYSKTPPRTWLPYSD
ncbi:unnamed protein product [Caenorhabditis nigoni]